LLSGGSKQELSVGDAAAASQVALY
jgi:hypothetical protein